MYELILAIIIFIIEIILLILWFQSRRKKTQKDGTICFIGFLIGQAYLIFEVSMVSQYGKPLSGSYEQKMLMLRLVLGTSIGGLFTIIGLFYLSFFIFKNKSGD